MFLAGVWDQGTFALLTAEAPPEWRGTVGPRMPVALSADHFDRWLSPGVTCLPDMQEIIAARRADWIRAAATPAIAPAYACPSEAQRTTALAAANSIQVTRSIESKGLDR